MTDRTTRAKRALKLATDTERLVPEGAATAGNVIISAEALKTLARDVLELEAECEHLRRVATEARDHSTALSAEIAELRDDYEALQAEHESAVTRGRELVVEAEVAATQAERRSARAMQDMHDTNVLLGDMSCQLRDRDTRIAELEAECEVLRQQRDYDYREALDGFAGLNAEIEWLESVIVGLNAEIEWLESVIAAGREMYARACAERDAEREACAANHRRLLERLELRLRDIEDRTAKVK